MSRFSGPLYYPLSSLSNPEWYPPVPEYTPPEGRRLSTQEIQLAHSGISNNPNNLSENFGNAWVWVSDTPITLDEWEKYNVAAFPYLPSESFCTHLQSFEQYQLYSYTNIIERVKWFVTFCCNDKGNEVLGMYCYRNKEAIKELTEFLVLSSVSNEEDKNEVIITLSQVYHQIS